MNVQHSPQPKIYGETTSHNKILSTLRSFFLSSILSHQLQMLQQP